MKIAAAVYCVVAGVLMAAWWGNDLRLGAWNRGDRTHAELGLHLTAEFVTAGLLISSGLARLLTGPGADSLVAAGLGMLLYTTIVSPGYFLVRRERPALYMFAILVVLTVAALVAVVA